MNTTRAFTAIALSVLLLAACQKRAVRTETVIGSETMEVIMPTRGNIEHPVHGKEVWFAIGAMSGKAPTKANGVAEAHVFTDDASSATVRLNIETPPKGTRYVAWLQKPGTTERIRLDILQNPLGDVRHAANVDVQEDIQDYTEVVVTLEAQAGAAAGDEVVAMGTLTERKR
ncbi:MAG: hypothetical protein HOO67_01355 [Candidatus Peribacteraceae bacterium]|nr:hypothetical protein [Candidatus Peribacteraceae bacterium]